MQNVLTLTKSFTGSLHSMSADNTTTRCLGIRIVCDAAWGEEGLSRLEELWQCIRRHAVGKDTSDIEKPAWIDDEDWSGFLDAYEELRHRGALYPITRRSDLDTPFKFVYTCPEMDQESGEETASLLICAVHIVHMKQSDNWKDETPICTRNSCVSYTLFNKHTCAGDTQSTLINEHNTIPLLQYYF